MNEFIQPRGMLDVMREALRRKVSGEISQETYEEAIRSVTPVVARETPSMAPAPTCQGNISGEPGTSRAEDQESTREDGSVTSVISPQDFISAFTTHTDQGDGTSQVKRLYQLLKDGIYHSTEEIKEYVYGSEELGFARAASRIRDLREMGYIIKRAKKMYGKVYGYRIEGKQDHPYYVDKEAV